MSCAVLSAGNFGANDYPAGMTKNSKDSSPSVEIVGSKRERRTQEERIAETRAKIIDAAVWSLRNHGYGATLLNTVAREAGVSKGGLTHHFPTKVDLMVAVLRHAYDGDIEAYRAFFASIDPSERFHALPKAAWKVMNRPTGIAAIEIMMATRSDPELASRIKAMQMDIERNALEQVVHLIDLAGFVPDKDVGALHRLLAASIRGLTIDASLLGRADEMDQAIELLTLLVRQLYDQNKVKAKA